MNFEKVEKELTKLIHRNFPESKDYKVQLVPLNVIDEFAQITKKQFITLKLWHKKNKKKFTWI